jgi:hypothetical protein
LGQQQLLMIVLAIIIVGIAIAISVQLFKSNAIESKRDLLIEETNSLAAMAIQYYKKPQAMGGGGRSFMGWEVPSQMVQTFNGNFMRAVVSATEVVITGTGSEAVTDTDSIKVETTVRPNEIFTIIIN